MGKKSSDKPTKFKMKIDEQKEKADSKTNNASDTQGKQYVCMVFLHTVKKRKFCFQNKTMRNNR